MTNFLQESSISLLAFLIFYYLFLEREKMHLFNRFYLLFSIVISLVLPFISFEIIKEIEVESIPIHFPVLLQENENIAKEKLDLTPFILWGIYVLISGIFLVKFIKNILSFKHIILKNEAVKFKNATLVLLEQKSIPHTFLQYIFLNKEDYFQNKIEHELYEHELTHVNQKHSFDIIFIELLKIIFWFNPLFYFYKKAIQLNHEFLADEKVVKTYNNVSFYQSLLLQSNDNKTYYLASNLNYLVTKKRLIMMTKSYSKRSGFIKKTGTIALTFMLILIFCIDIIAQETQKQEFPIKELDKIYENTRVIVKDKEGKILTNKMYPELTEEDKKLLPHPTSKPSKKEISKQQFDEFKNQSKYAVWIDNQPVKNSELNKYKPSDFVFFSNSHINKNDRSKKFPQENQVTLYTEKGYSEAFEKKKESYVGTIEIIKYEGVNAVMKLKTIDLNSKLQDSVKTKSGYRYLENQIYYFIQQDDAETEFYNRWGTLITDKDLIQKLLNSKEIELSKLNETTSIYEDTTNENEFIITGYKNPIKKENGKFYYDNKEIDIQNALKSEGYLYMRKSTYYYINKDSKITIYDRWGKVSSELSDFFNL